MESTVRPPRSAPARAGGDAPPEPRETTSPATERLAARRRMLRRVTMNTILGLAGFAVILGFWHTVSTLELIRPGLLPSPALVAEVMWQGLVSGTLLTDLIVSSRRVIIGVAIGMAIAIPFGFALGWFPRVRVMFNPLVNFFRALPPIALVPLVVIYFGIGELARESILVYGTFFATVIVVYEGVGGIEEKYIRAGQTLGTNRLELFTRVVFPLSTPHIFTAARVSLGIGWSSLVAAELVAAQSGLGAAIQNASNFLDVPGMYAGIILIGLAALVMDLAIRLFAARALRWQDRGER